MDSVTPGPDASGGGIADSIANLGLEVLDVCNFSSSANLGGARELDFQGGFDVDRVNHGHASNDSEADRVVIALRHWIGRIA